MNFAPIECIDAVTRTDAYTELILHADATITLHAEDGSTVAQPIYTLPEAEDLHRALGHLLWLAHTDQRLAGAR